MKKTLFFVAAAALALTACTNETDIVQTPKQVEQQGVAFDVYTPTATTRSGRANVMTTSIMKQTGFGVYAYQNDRSDVSSFPAPNQYDYSVGPNYMWNQQVNWNTTGNGWYYAPLKYWPNETLNDSQASPSYMPDVETPTVGNIDQLSFFAYAPWVSAATSGAVSTINGNMEAATTTGITTISANTTTANEPTIWYTASSDPDYSVDLLWGVAPLGGLSYVNVAGQTVSIAEGMPLIGLTKPTVNTTIKFLFQHSLARIGVKVVAAVDQVSPGGTFDYGNTKITIKDIRIMGEYGTVGTLNLNNYDKGPNTPNWTITTIGNTDATALKIADGTGLAPHLVYNATKAGANEQQIVTGVTTSVADAIKVRSLYDANYSADCATAEVKPAYSAIRPYFADAADIVETGSPATPNYANYNNFSKAGSTTYLQKYVTNNGVTYTDITTPINTTYPNATVWENIYSIPDSYIHKVDATDYTNGTYNGYTAYRLVGAVYTQTGTAPQVGDYVFTNGSGEVTNLTSVPTPSVGSATYYKAKPNYFMVIPPTNPANKTIRVKITYYVSTTDANLKDGIVYTENQVEQEVELPDFKNGRSYDLKLILGLTSVKLEAEATDWVTTNAEVNLPQNTSE